MKKKIIRFYFNYKFYIFPLVVTISSLFLIVFAIYPQTVKLINNQRVASELNNKSKLLDDKVEALEGLDEEDLLHKVNFALGALPADKDFVQAIGLLQQLVSQAGFTITTISFSNAVSKVDKSDSFEVKVELAGTQVLFPSLLSSLENSLRLIRIKNMDFSSTQNQQTLGVSLTLDVLYSKLPQDFGSIDTPLPKLSQKDEDLLNYLEKASAGITGSSQGSAGFAQPPRGKVNPFE